MRSIKSATLALVAVSAFGMAAAADATASHPEFRTKSGLNLSFTGTSGTSILRGEQANILVTITCEKDTSSGTILHKTPLLDKIEVTFSGKCHQEIGGGSPEACTEPIKINLARGELGLVTGKKAGLYVTPETGTKFVTIECGGKATEIAGSVIGEFPELSKSGVNQYNKLLPNFELRFSATAASQNLTEIELLGTRLIGQHLVLSGFLGGQASEETDETLTGDGEFEIVTT